MNIVIAFKTGFVNLLETSHTPTCYYLRGKMPENGLVVWEVEDPSEFRPELPYTAGKDKTEFRIYDAVSFDTLSF